MLLCLTYHCDSLLFDDDGRRHRSRLRPRSRTSVYRGPGIKTSEGAGVDDADFGTGSGGSLRVVPSAF